MDGDQASAPPAEPGAGSSELNELVARCVDRFDAEGDSALEDLCREHPSHADKLRSRVRALQRAGLIGGAPKPGSFPERLGEFRLVRYLGGGGMGAVYLAVQEPLGREVALKLVRPDQLYFPGARERFRREVELVAKLQHTGIVPIYTCGEEQGIPYFAMERVQGCTLGEVLRELAGADPAKLEGADLERAVRTCAARNGADVRPPLALPAAAFAGGWVETCLRLVRQAAQALEHAHAHGVLHRDVKPSNLMIAPDGRLLLMDFGLATSDGASHLTRTGSRLGSLPYLAPEVLRGGAAGASADVYALGVTLYELLGLVTPYGQESVEATQQAILRGEPMRPRERNRAVPADVETVCLTAMDPDPARRYADARACERDLSNILAVRPIEARPAGAALRARRWVQRHPTTTVAAAAGFLLLVVAPTTAWWRIKKERDAALVELRARRGMLDFFLDVIEGADPSRQVGGQQASLDAVVEAATRRIREDLADHPRVRMELLASLATVQHRLRRPREAVALREEALALVDELDFDQRPFVLGCKQSLAAGLIELGELERGKALLREIRDDVVAHGTAGELTLWRVDSYLAHAHVLERDFAGAKPLLEALAEDPSAPVHVDGEQRIEWLKNMALANEGLGDTERGLELMADAVETSARVYGRQHVITAAHIQTLAAMHGDLGQADRALPLLEEVRDIRAAVGAPESLQDAILAANLGATYHRLRRLDECLAQYQRALELTRRYAPHSAQLARIAAGTGAILLKMDRLDEAEPLLREALELGRNYLPQRGGIGAEAPMWLGRCLVRQGKREEALPLFEQGLAFTRDDPSVPQFFREECRRETAELLEALGRAEEAAALRAGIQ